MDYDEEIRAPRALGHFIPRFGDRTPQPVTAKTGARDPRTELVGFFTDKLNAARKGTKWKPLSYAKVNDLLAKRYPTKSLFPLEALKGKCLEAEKLDIMPFSAQFFIEVNKKPEQQKLL